MANEKRLIDANALVAKIAKAQDDLETNNDALWKINQKYYKGLAWAHRLVLDAPTVDAVEVVHGEWAIVGDACVCSVCNKWAVQDYYYCPHCGAKMDGDGDA